MLCSKNITGHITLNVGNIFSHNKTEEFSSTFGYKIQIVLCDVKLFYNTLKLGVFQKKSIRFLFICKLCSISCACTCMIEIIDQNLKYLLNSYLKSVSTINDDKQALY